MSTKREILAATFPATLRLLELINEHQHSMDDAPMILIANQLTLAFAEFGAAAVVGVNADEQPSGCLAGAADDEPLFILTAHDAMAPFTIMAWVNGWEKWATMLSEPGAAPIGLKRKCNLARDDVRAMVLWEKSHGARVPQ